MKFFWIILLAAAALAVAWSLWPESPATPSRDLAPIEPTVAVAASPEDEAPIKASSPESASPTPVRADSAEETRAPEAASSTAGAPESEVAASPAAPEPAAEPADPPLPLGLDASIPDATVVAGSILRGPNDVLLADDRFEIEGDGTREKPYRVSWELLVSAGESYRPRVGDRGIPQRIAMLDGKWVAIDGYVAFPMLVGTTSEALVMLNRWDGCCIGVPPSPYDAIEVKLDRPVVRTQMHAIDYGEVVGVLEVEPYLVDDWLVGLYLMDGAAMKLDL